VATALIICACAAVFWQSLRRSEGQTTSNTTRPEPKDGAIPKEALSIANASSQGSASAPIAMIVFSDFECPFCARFAKDTMPAIVEAYVKPGKLLLAFRHNPWEARHPRALASAVAAECAGQQGLFWAMHDALFADPRSLDDVSLVRSAARIGVDKSQFQRCLNSEVSTKIRQDGILAKTLRIGGTPTVLIGRVVADQKIQVMRHISGARPAQYFTGAIDQILGETKEAKR